MRPMVGTIHEDDWAGIDQGVKIAQMATRELHAAGVRIVIPHEMRWWEYGSAIQLVLRWMAREKESVAKIRPMDILDIGSGWGVVGPALLLQFDRLIHMTEYEPDQMYWADRAMCNQYLERTGRAPINYHHFDLMAMPEQDYDAVFCISVLEHVPSPHPERECWAELAKRVRPGGVLFVDVDTVPVQKPKGGYVFDELRAHNFDIGELKDRVRILEDCGLVPIGQPDWNYNGSVVHDFTFFRIAMERLFPHDS